MFLHLKEESGFRAGKFCEPPLFRNISKQGDGYLDVYGRTLDFLSVKQGNSDRVVYGPPPALGEGWLEPWRGARCELPRAGRSPFINI